ncbi:BZIP domain-containing protein [Caenorhabditis elegans]|uniref:BZIP domain-containing protein n=1 Tax=Caenorhabditis elegans TaxID=6239 RepID=Q9NAE4_CAEEL|nr:BZIP domain-containing protein [Caenorhabditis elegans]CAB61136.1 BZIP domain-containing protein [Caenorhabditis elegans]|eukprot:NP_502961.1 bZIP transcription factor family [Caenorhabditis elegans]
MMTDIQQQLAASRMCDSDSIKAFNQMYAQNPYGAGAFDKNYSAATALPFFAQHFAPYANPHATSSFSPSSSSTSSTTSSQNQQSGSSGSKKKKPVPVPENQKDEAYLDRRRRNNEAARKSRESRKKVDQDNSVRVTYLERENQCLRVYVQQLQLQNESMRQHLLLQNPGTIDTMDPIAMANMPSY